VPGNQTLRYGGNTSCVELVNGHGRIVLDAGTGIRLLGATITAPEELYLILTHLHWDHIQGIPFFGPMYRKESSIHIYSGHKADVSLEAVLRGQMQEPNFPVSLGGMPARITFNEVPKGSNVELPGVNVATIKLNHPNEATGFRFDCQGKVFVHLTDHEHTPEYEDIIPAFCDGADVLSMDTMYTPDQYPTHIGWGHSTWLHACEIAKRANARKLVLFHHDPRHTDDAMDAIADKARKEFSNCVVAREGLLLEL